MIHAYPTARAEGRQPPRGGSAFALDDDKAYRLWRDAKFAGYPRSVDELWVEVSSLSAPTPAETDAILARCARSNMCLYRIRQRLDGTHGARTALGAFARHFGLHRFEAHRSAQVDGVVDIEVVEEGHQLGYVPYTNRPIGWHTDGYYNCESPARMIRGVVLHCVRGASRGGANGLLDHEIAYIRLRDENPDFITALMHPEAMTIPANETTEKMMRARNTGPVFLINPDTGMLTMRYTMRKHNIRWREDPATHAAVHALERTLHEEPLVLRVRLEPGEGVICNNVLHNRGGFEDSPAPGLGRLIYRVRSYDHVARTPSS